MYCPSTPKSLLLSKLALVIFMLSQAADAQTVSDTTKSLNAFGDNGYWQSGQPDVMILWPADNRNVVNRFTGSADHPYPYRLWVDPARNGGFPVVLKNEAAFNNFLEHIKQNSDKDWCQVAETWSAWSGNPPGACGTHSYAERRTCSVAADAEKPCPDLCNPAVETRTRQVDNGSCKPEPPPPNRCSTSAWAPSTGTVCAGDRFTQARTRADCSTDRRSAVGTKSCAQSCPVTAWAPDRNTACSGETLTQTRTLSDCSPGRRTVSGTRSCRQTCPATAWSPATSTVCAGESLTQTRTLADCSSDRRTVSGTKSCRPSCPATAWSPATSAVCTGNSFSQSRTLADCSTRSRTATGTKNCRKAECSNGQSYCSSYKRYLCRNGKWEVIAHGPYACFTP